MTRVRHCLSCGAAGLAPALSLGEQPLANRFLDAAGLDAPEPRFPLELVWCGGCGLLQLSVHVDPEILFRDYIYVTGTSSTMERHHRALVDAHIARFGLKAGDLAVDVASNDGSLLRIFKERGLRVLGVEPARNLARAAEASGVPTVDRFFGAETARDVRREHGPARHVSANNVMAHVPDLNGFLEGLRILAEPDGVVSVEAPYLAPMLERLEYDTVYHEHLSYFAVRPVAAAFARHGLGLIDLVPTPVHGGTMRYVARPGVAHAPVVDDAIARERAAGFERLETYLEFARRVAGNRDALRGSLVDLKARGRAVAAYGAPAKGNTLLNYCGIGTDLVAFCVDRNPLKVGKYTPGMRIPVLPVEELRRRRPDVALVLPWNLTDEIVAQESAYRAAGGRFMVPVPEPKLL
ncbi:MAG TPA: class I SAM-dependent methyltransferase [Planctomycetota bacterium]|nr:class I SAM-dependent methyltransferase [Planctomycetota bacterium]